jgi:hypothetical protein
MTKIASNSNDYGIRRLPARGTRIKTPVITIAYIIVRFHIFRQNFRAALKTHAKSSYQLSVLLAFLLVSREQTFTANFAIPNEGIEQMARKNHGASANPNTSTDRSRRHDPPALSPQAVAEFPR